MRSDCLAVRNGKGDRLLHRHRVAGMEPAGNVSAIDKRHDSGIVAEAPIAIAFAHIAVECDRHLIPFSV